MKKNLIASGIAFLSLFLLFSCSSQTETSSLILDEKEFVFEGPIYSGPNSSTVTVNVDLSRVIPQGNTFIKAKLSNATIFGDSSLVFSDLANTLALHISSSTEKMKQIAVKNPVSALSEQELQVAQDSELEAVFKGGNFFLTLDADFINDNETDDSISLYGKFTFEITSKK